MSRGLGSSLHNSSRALPNGRLDGSAIELQELRLPLDNPSDAISSPKGISSPKPSLGKQAPSAMFLHDDDAIMLAEPHSKDDLTEGDTESQKSKKPRAVHTHWKLMVLAAAFLVLVAWCFLAGALVAEWYVPLSLDTDRRDFWAGPNATVEAVGIFIPQAPELFVNSTTVNVTQTIDINGTTFNITFPVTTNETIRCDNRTDAGTEQAKRCKRCRLTVFQHWVSYRADCRSTCGSAVCDQVPDGWRDWRDDACNFGLPTNLWSPTCSAIKLVFNVSITILSLSLVCCTVVVVLLVLRAAQLFGQWMRWITMPTVVVAALIVWIPPIVFGALLPVAIGNDQPDLCVEDSSAFDTSPCVAFRACQRLSDGTEWCWGPSVGWVLAVLAVPAMAGAAVLAIVGEIVRFRAYKNYSVNLAISAEGEIDELKRELGTDVAASRVRKIVNADGAAVQRSKTTPRLSTLHRGRAINFGDDDDSDGDDSSAARPLAVAAANALANMLDEGYADGSSSSSTSSSSFSSSSSSSRSSSNASSRSPSPVPSAQKSSADAQGALAVPAPSLRSSSQSSSSGGSSSQAAALEHGEEKLTDELTLDRVLGAGLDAAALRSQDLDPIKLDKEERQSSPPGSTKVRNLRPGAARFVDVDGDRAGDVVLLRRRTESIHDAEPKPAKSALRKPATHARAVPQPTSMRPSSNVPLSPVVERPAARPPEHSPSAAAFARPSSRGSVSEAPQPRPVSRLVQHARSTTPLAQARSSQGSVSDHSEVDDNPLFSRPSFSSPSPSAPSPKNRR